MGALSALQSTARGIGKLPRMVGDSMYAKAYGSVGDYAQKPGFGIPGVPSPDDDRTDEEAAMQQASLPPTVDMEAQNPASVQPEPPVPQPGPKSFDFPEFKGPTGNSMTTAESRRPENGPSMLGKFVKGTLPNMISGAINAAATPNIAGGGPTDIFRAMQASQGAQTQKDLLAYNQRRQQTADDLAAKKEADQAESANIRAKAYSAAQDSKSDPKTVEQYYVQAITAETDPQKQAALRNELAAFKSNQAFLTNYQEIPEASLNDWIQAGVQPVLKDGKHYVLKSAVVADLNNQSKESIAGDKMTAQATAAGLKDPMAQQARYLAALPENKSLSPGELQAKAAAQVIDMQRSKLKTTEEKNAEAAGVDMAEWYKARIDNLVARTKKAQVAAAGGPLSPVGLENAAAEDPILDLKALRYMADGNYEVRGRGGPEMRAEVAKIDARSKQIAEKLHLSGAEIMALRTDRKAAIPALAKVFTYDAMIGAFENTLKNNIKTLREISDKVDRGDIVFVNKLQQAFQRGTGDPEILKLAAQLRGVSREWGKIMIGSTSAAGLPITEARDTDELMSAALSKGQLNGLIDGVILKDVDNRREANKQQLAETRAQINGLTNRLMPQQGAPAAPPAQPPPQNPTVVQQQINPNGAPPIKFMWNGEPYTVPAEKSQQFLKEHPGATTR